VILRTKLDVSILDGAVVDGAKRDNHLYPKMKGQGLNIGGSMIQPTPCNSSARDILKDSTSSTLKHMGPFFNQRGSRGTLRSPKSSGPTVNI